MSFNDWPPMGLRDIAAFCEDCDAMRVGPNSGSFLATKVMDEKYDGLFDPLVRAMTVQEIYAYYDKCRAEHRDSGD